MSNIQFRSEKSPIVYVALAILIAALILVVFASKNAPWFVTIFSVLVIGFIGMPVLLFTRYTIKGNILNVRSGLIVNSNIDILSIKKITGTNTIASAPALSVKDRIEIHYNKFDDIIISPACRENFLKELLRINPAIVIEL